MDLRFFIPFKGDHNGICFKMEFTVKKMWNILLNSASFFLMESFDFEKFLSVI